MIAKFASWIVTILDVHRRLTDLEDRTVLVLADLWFRQNGSVTSSESEDHMKLSRILLSGTERLNVSGTQSEVEAAAIRMSRRTKTCVTVAVAVGHYHRRNCDELPRGGFTEAGD